MNVMRGHVRALVVAVTAVSAAIAALGVARGQLPVDATNLTGAVLTAGDAEAGW